MSSAIAARYDGKTDSINSRTQFIKETRAGWAPIPTDPSRHVLKGYTQFDYISSLGPKLTGTPLRLLIQWVDKWDYNNTLHDNNDEAILREVDDSGGASITIREHVLYYNKCRNHLN